MSEPESSSLWLEARATLVESLLRELHQTERSCATHCRREAARFPNERPAFALLHLADHAESVLERMKPVGRDGAAQKLAQGLGSLFSACRELVLDNIVREERSYRGTLLGVRHGIDLVILLRNAAISEKSDLMLEFADKWLEKRTVLWEEAVAALQWFDENPERALAVRARAKASLRAKKYEAYEAEVNDTREMAPPSAELGGAI
jgi:hypothetical protein